MTRRIFFALAAFTATVTCAQQAIPSSTVPLNGEVMVRYAPTFEARCTANKYEKKSGDFFGERKTETSTSSIYEDSPGATKYSVISEMAGNYLRMSFDVEADGSGFSPTEADLHVRSSEGAPWVNVYDIQGSEKEDLIKVKQFLTDVVKNSGSYSWVGKPLRQGSVVSGDMCAIFPGGRAKSSLGMFAVVGTAAVQGRDSIIISGSQNLACTFLGQELKIDVKGWYALDIQSGLLAAQSFVSRGTMTSKGDWASTEDLQCSINGVPTKKDRATVSVTPDSKSVEQRLTELKSLLDKGLITQEQFEKKRLEIIKTL